jgi:A/G-specific adenine glycosylase
MTDWQRCAGRHGLPWQGVGDPYRTWLSEVMLQQTQVATVLPAYLRFVERFPDVERLAAAPLDVVLGLWSGLGYYSRARNLHRAAQALAQAGGFPHHVEGLTALPGVGRSTAAAIVSLAWDRPAAILDGNVRRVLARHAGIDGWPGDPVVARRLWKEAESRLPPQDSPAGTGSTYTQALMDLGATVCHRRRPDCPRCPVGDDCEARLSGRTHALPAPRPARERPVHRMDLLLDCSAQGVTLVRRSDRGIWGGLWCLPEQPGGEAWDTIRHELTHLRLDIVVGRAGSSSLASAPDGSPLSPRCFAWPEVWALGLPQPVRAVLKRAHAEFVTAASPTLPLAVAE